MTLPRFGRRAFLRGTGATMMLPWLEAVAERLPRALRAPPVRMAILVTPNGVLPQAWEPVATEGGGYVPSFALTPISPRIRDVSVLTGLCNRQSFLGDGHYAKVAPLLTGQEIRRTGGRDLANGISMDQFAAQQLGGRTLLPSLELGCDPITPVEDMGYSTVYGGHIAWGANSQPITKEIVPRLLFDRMFRSTTMAADPARQSVLDLVKRDADRLAANLGVRDREKLIEYQESVRALELRIAAAELAPRQSLTAADAPQKGVPANYADHVALMTDLIALAFATDTTRIVTFLLANEVSGRDFSFVEGCSGGFHDFSHHEGKPEKQDAYRRINRWHVEQYAALLDKLAAHEEGGTSLLDNSMIVLAAAMRDGNAHDPHDLPILLAGRAGGAIESGRLIASPTDTPVCSLWLGMLQKFGVATNRFGDADHALL
ncbi:hypothetical protein LBMAG49_07900 [Planctomycetota bacterium]|nr:DUF1552 domain-containing protein [Planctomycetota bacterium]MSR38759.1 DUF1552 domain-containing protein [Planctomycetota bacterium]GDY01461.1 hypothetical protein LBMAG49_07900 [Planctomycetota bacterium]